MFLARGPLRFMNAEWKRERRLHELVLMIARYLRKSRVDIGHIQSSLPVDINFYPYFGKGASWIIDHQSSQPAF